MEFRRAVESNAGFRELGRTELTPRVVPLCDMHKFENRSLSAKGGTTS